MPVPLRVKATIQKVMRQNGKQESIMQVAIPSDSFATIPLGEVNLIITPVQESMFPPKGEAQHVHGDKG